MLVERISRRAPPASLRMLAVTPAPAALILSRTLASVSVASTVMSTAGRVALGARLVLPAFQVPISIRSVPALSAVVLDAKTPVLMDCALARLCTSTE